jgi:hypothetical protein
VGCRPLTQPKRLNVLVTLSFRESIVDRPLNRPLQQVVIVGVNQVEIEEIPSAIRKSDLRRITEMKMKALVRA